jgi:hypothetical protein
MKCLPVIALITVLATSNTMAAGKAQLLNGGFEDPSIIGGGEIGDTPKEWYHFTSGQGSHPGVSQQKRRDGLQSCLLSCQETVDGYTGIAQKFPAVAGRRYQFSAYALNNVTDSVVGESFGQVSLEWLDETGEEIERMFGPTWNFQLSPLSWQRFEVDAVAPDGAFEGIAVVTFYGRDGAGEGSFFIDDAKLVEKSKAPAKEE